MTRTQIPMARKAAGSRNAAGTRLLNVTKPTYGLSFVESNSRVTIANNAALNTLSALTLECFFRPGGTPTVAERLLDKQGAANKGYNIIFNTGRNIQLAVGNSTTQVGPTGAVVLKPLNTYHIAMTWDGANVKLWVNGVQDGSSVLSGGNTGDDGGAFTIGNRPAFDRGAFGIIQEVRLSNVARYTSAFTPPSSQFAIDASTIGLWHVNEGTGTTVADSTTNGLTGTLGGTANPQWALGYLTTHTGTGRRPAS